MKKPFLSICLMLATVFLLSCFDESTESHNIMRDYKFEGRFIIINRCSDSSAEIPALLRFDLDHTYKQGSSRNIVVNDLETHPMKSNKMRGSKYSFFRFGVITGKFAENWVINSVTSKTGEDICGLIKVPGAECVNTGNKSWEIPAVQNDMSPYIVNRDIEIICGIKQPG